MYRTAISRPVNKGIYKYIRNRIYRINEKEGNRNYPNGDLTKDVSTWSSTYIKTLDYLRKSFSAKGGKLRCLTLTSYGR